MEELMKTKIFKVTVERLLLNGGQTLYMVGEKSDVVLASQRNDHRNDPGTDPGALQKRRIGGEPTVIYDRQRLHQRGAQYPLCYSSCNDHADHPRYCRNDHRKYGSVGAVSSLYKSVPCEADGEQPA